MIPPEELEVKTGRPNPGGQHVGTYTGVTITHIPTGIKVTVAAARSQHRNKLIAVEMLEAALTSPHID